jgi:plastocyanin
LFYNREKFIIKGKYKMKFLLSIVLLICSTHLYAGISVTPNPGTAGNWFKFSADLTQNLPSGYSVKLEIGDGGGGYLAAKTMRGSGSHYYYGAKITQPGNNRKYRIAIFKNSTRKAAWKYGFYTVNSSSSSSSGSSSSSPTINSVSVSPTRAISGNTFTFTANLSSSLPNSYRLDVDFGAGYRTMSRVSSTRYTKSSPVNSSGSRSFTVKLLNNGRTVMTKSGSYYVEAKAVKNLPTISISSANTSVAQNSTYSINLNMRDVNGNLKNVFINWGDGSSLSIGELSGSSQSKSFTHTYANSGNYTWQAEVHDHDEQTAKVSKAVRVIANAPSVSLNSAFVSPTKAVSGSTFTFTANLSSSLPRGYRLEVDFGAGYQVMSRSSSTQYTKSSPVNSSGERRYTIRLLNNGQTVTTKSGTYTVEAKAVKNRPTISISSANASVTQNSTYSINLNMRDVDGNLKNVFVNWGDGSSQSIGELRGSSQSKVFTHTYAKSGNYTWSAEVHDHDEQTTRVSKTVSVAAKIIKNSPTISISSANTFVTQNSRYSINLNMKDINGNLKNVSVNWGDGSPLSTVELSGASQSKILSHTYVKGGLYTWRAEVHDHDEKVARVSQAVNVRGANVPNINITSVLANPAKAISGSTFTFIANLSSSVPNGYRLEVDYGVGYQAMNRSSSIRYTKSGIANKLGPQNITVKLLDSAGKTIATKTGVYTVDSKEVSKDPEQPVIPKAKVVGVTTSQITAGKAFGVDFNIIGKNLDRVVLEWGDGKTDSIKLNGSNVTFRHTYLAAGSFPAKLISYDVGGKRTVLVSANIVVKAGVAGVNSAQTIGIIDVSVSSESGEYKQGEEFTFVAGLNDILPDGYKTTFRFADTTIDSMEMACLSTTCEYKNRMNDAGENRPFEIKILDDNNQTIDVVEGNYSVQGILLPDVSIRDISTSMNTLANGIKKYKAGEDKIELELTPTGNVDHIDVIWQLRGSEYDDEFERLKVSYNIDENNSSIIVGRTYPVEEINKYFSEKHGYSAAFFTLKITAYNSDGIAGEVNDYKINVYNLEQFNNHEKYLEEHAEIGTNTTEEIEPVKTKELFKSCVPVYIESKRVGNENILSLPCIKIDKKDVYYRAKMTVSFNDGEIKLKILENSLNKLVKNEKINIDEKCLSTFISKDSMVYASCVAAVLKSTEKVNNYKINLSYDSATNTLIVTNLEEDSENIVSSGTKLDIAESLKDGGQCSKKDVKSYEVKGSQSSELCRSKVNEELGDRFENKNANLKDLYSKLDELIYLADNPKQQKYNQLTLSVVTLANSIINNKFESLINNSNDVISNLKNQSIFYKGNDELVDYLKIAKKVETDNLTKITKNSKIFKTVDFIGETTGHLLNLYELKKAVDNATENIIEGEANLKNSYLPVAEKIISFNPVAGGILHIRDEIITAIDLSRDIEHEYKNALSGYRDQYFNQYHILAKRGFEGKPKEKFMQLYKKQREDLRKNIDDFSKNVNKGITPYLGIKIEKLNKDINYLKELLDNENDIIRKQNNIYNSMYKKYENKVLIDNFKNKINKLDTNNELNSAR